MNIRKDTAVAVEVGPILNVDGTPYVTDNLVRTDFRLTKNGATGALNASATVAHVTGDLQGMFLVSLTASDTDTLGNVAVTPNKATLAGVPWRGNVATQSAWDALYAASGGFLLAKNHAGSTIAVAGEAAAALASYDPPTKAEMDTAIAGTGTGAYTITITVNDGTTPLESAKVRVTKGAESYLGTTNASGVVPFHLDAGTWAVAITLPLYTFTGTTKVVSADGPQTYSMTAQSIPASAANQVTGYVYCYTSAGAAKAGVVVTLRQIDYPAATGGGYDLTARTATTDANGIASFTGCWPGATYTIKGTGTTRTYKIPASATRTVALASFMGVA